MAVIRFFLVSLQLAAVVVANLRLEARLSVVQVVVGLSTKMVRQEQRIREIRAEMVLILATNRPHRFFRRPRQPQ